MIFTMPGVPEGKARARTVAQGGRVHSYTPQKTRDYEEKARLCWMEAGHAGFGDAPVAVSIIAEHPIPRSASKRARQLMERGWHLPCVKPDADNIAKIVCDALNGLAYGDDKQIVRLEVVKRYAAGDACVVVEIREACYGA